MYGSFTGGMAAVVFLCFFQLCGLCLSAVIFPREGPGTRTLLGSVLGSVSLQWLPALMGFVSGFTRAGHMAAAVIITLAVCGTLIWAKRSFMPIDKIGRAHV